MKTDAHYEGCAWTIKELELLTAARLEKPELSWRQIAERVGRPAGACQARVKRLRNSKKFQHSHSVRRPPKGPGRPKNRAVSIGVSLSTSPEVADAFAHVADVLGLRPGVLLGVALLGCYPTRHGRGKSGLWQRASAFELAEGARELIATPRTKKLNYCVEAKAVKVATANGRVKAHAARVAVHELLEAHGYVLIAGENG